jgi:hypothetical protein
MLSTLNVLLLLILITLTLTIPRLFKSRISPSALPKPWIVVSGIIALTLFGCVLSSLVLHEPIPRLHDEFSYSLMGDTLAHGRATNPTPPLSEFFDTFHVLVHPFYVSKYFPAQGLFLALGEKLTGHPAFGLWLSSALACAATAWMLQAWLTPAWGLLGGLLMVVEYGVFSYWSQTYWGGMVAALGGALFFGAFRRLWDHFSWENSSLLALGAVILVNSRPTEGILAATPASVTFVWRLVRARRWLEPGFLHKMALPFLAVLLLGAFATGTYNHAISGSSFKSPYMLHEQQYQQSPPFVFLPQRAHIEYSSPWLRYYYEFQEMRLYATQRIPKLWVLAVARKIATFWSFYCGILLGAPLVLVGLLRKGRCRILQSIFLAGLITLPFIEESHGIVWRLLVDVLAILEIGLLWHVFADFWSRLAIGTGVLLLCEATLVKWSFPHYFAPAACLVLYLEVEALRRIWKWTPTEEKAAAGLSRQQRRRLEGGNGAEQKFPQSLRGVVYLLPLACLISLFVRVDARMQGWNDDVYGPDREALLMNDWSLHRADLEHWLENQPTPQLVFVQYTANHDVNSEWVYNHADIMHSHVIWARDLGSEHNRQLLQQVTNRTVWLIQADRSDPQLISYSDLDPDAPLGVAPQVGAVPKREQLDW